VSLPDCPYRGQAECEHDACQPCAAGRMHQAVAESDRASVELTSAAAMTTRCQLLLLAELCPEGWR